MKKVVLFIVISILFLYPASALTVKQESYDIAIHIPTDYITLTAENVGDNSIDYEDYISKSEAAKRFNETAQESRMVIDAFAKDRKSEIQVKIRKADTVSETITDFTLLSQARQKNILNTLLDGFHQSSYKITVLSSEIITKKQYTFMKITARQGTTATGYCFTNYVTILNKEYYDLTIYHSIAAPSDETEKQDNNIFQSLKLIDHNKKSLGATDIILIVLIFLAILAVVVICFFILYSLYYDFKNRRRSDEYIRLRKR